MFHPREKIVVGFLRQDGFGFGVTAAVPYGVVESNANDYARSGCGGSHRDKCRRVLVVRLGRQETNAGLQHPAQNLTPLGNEYFAACALDQARVVFYRQRSVAVRRQRASDCAQRLRHRHIREPAIADRRECALLASGKIHGGLTRTVFDCGSSRTRDALIRIGRTASREKQQQRSEHAAHRAACAYPKTTRTAGFDAICHAGGELFAVEKLLRTSAILVSPQRFLQLKDFAGTARNTWI